ncbi:hypothetical protein DV737_g4565, partial [Chaetothyriales sp. CBS 132003]
MAPPKKWEEEEESSSEEEESSDESVDVPVAAPRKKFDDEEDSDDNHKTKSQRREEQIEARRRARLAEEEGDSSEEDEASRRAQLRQQEKDADLGNAADLLGSVGGVSNKRAAKPIVVADPKTQGQAIDLSSIQLFKPTNKTQFEALRDALVPLLRQSSTKPHYALWLPTFVKQICQDLPSAEIKKVASAVTALSNEKMKEEKAQDKSGKKTKAQQTKTTLKAAKEVGRGGVDTEAYDGDGLDDAFFLRSTSILPQPYTSGDANMLSLAFFILAGLDLLGLLASSDEKDGSEPATTTNATHSKRISPAQKRGWIQWIYSFQAPHYGGGLRGSRFWDLGDESRLLWEKGWDRASLANTFLGLLMLLMLGDDLELLRKEELALWVKGLQSERGGFAEELPGEKGNLERQLQDGGSPHEYFGLPLQREVPFIAGFNGRTNKMADTCYCFWNLSALDILGMPDLADHDALRRYLLDKTQHKIGGFSKAPGEHPDLMHSYLGLAALAVMKEEGLAELDPALCQ